MTIEPVNNIEPSNRSWLIGSGDDCDVVIDHPKVSKHHCQLTRTGDRLSIQDVNSENGTWIDGVPYVGPKPIRRGSSIMLGETVEMLWPVDLIEFKSVIAIGRSQDNDVVLDKPNVSGRHARLIDDGTALWIEDCGSTNGVALNRPDNLVRHHRVVPGDAIYLGSTRITIDRILKVGVATDSVNGQVFADRLAEKMLSTTLVSDGERKRQQKFRSALLTCFAIASILIGAACAVYFARIAEPTGPSGDRVPQAVR
ncbi:FHA domain-containing protein FhaB [Rosistilla ulvae]|uniref:FHA domain-containing protein FhaB n=1 Tax=Rosistilla ulvae TaxID=1930277 RepID=A0A517M394_9BACT|nr:FHA domain-containing protein [Rosistilla ulvae]QDS89343.1 FHA domain-containing protein FhaB [Rosistilla ulvae]